MDTSATPNPSPNQQPAPAELTGTGAREAALKALRSTEATPVQAETAPTPAADAAPVAMPGAVVQPASHLTRDDVAAAIAAMPGPSGPGAPATPVPVPATANDQDVVEAEWVDAAEKVIAQTQDKPYEEEEAFEGLQIDYLKKRYGHEVKKPEDS